MFFPFLDRFIYNWARGWWGRWWQCRKWRWWWTFQCCWTWCHPPSYITTVSEKLAARYLLWSFIIFLTIFIIFLLWQHQSTKLWIVKVWNSSSSAICCRVHAALFFQKTDIRNMIPIRCEFHSVGKFLSVNFKKHQICSMWAFDVLIKHEATFRPKWSLWLQVANQSVCCGVPDEGHGSLWRGWGSVWPHQGQGA